MLLSLTKQHIYHNDLNRYWQNQTNPIDFENDQQPKLMIAKHF